MHHLVFSTTRTCILKKKYGKKYYQKVFIEFACFKIKIVSFFKSNKYPSKTYSDRYSKREDGRPRDVSPASRNSPRYIHKKPYSEKDKGRMERGKFWNRNFLKSWLSQINVSSDDISGLDSWTIELR